MKVVVAIDSPESGEAAFKYLAKATFGQKDQIHLVHVIVPGFADAPYAGIPDVVLEERETEQKLLGGLAKAIKEKLGAAITTEILVGEVGKVIADVCRRLEADEVLVPSHARRGLDRFLHGSVADEIVDEAPCTVVVLKLPQWCKA